ncbi:isoleucine--tRNA ligase [Candidatus Shikimatogenerans bostrichidophilus]|uniref:isoleucine--tRNA ligase n=1 Tax=Candidatus Shikimatogenerans bostrichidophilus TaxID=2943807 RepID=UPI00296728EA
MGYLLINNYYNIVNLYKIYKKIFNNWKKKKLLFYYKQNKKKFIILDGPPSMNGKPGVHHIFSRIIKDIIYRFYTMNNYKVIYKLGWDTHGLPIEIEVEKKLNIKKKDIGNKITVKLFNKYCKKFIKKNLIIWKKFTNYIGYFFNKKNYFITYSNKYIESIWWIIKKIYNKKLLYKEYNVLPYSPIAGTPISYQELNFPYTHKYIIDFSIYVLFELKSNIFFNNNKKIYLLAWTTTPWTLPSNSALLVKNDWYYYLVKIYNIFDFKYIYIILSKYSINKILKNKQYKILLKFLGNKLVGLKYKQLIKWIKPINKNNKIFLIISDSFNIIKNNVGTGIIHIAPNYGKEDFEIAKINNIDNLYNIVDNNGKFIKQVPLGLGGKYIKKEYYKPNKQFSVDKIIIKYLKKKNKIFKINKYKHLYPHCWRTNKPIIYYPIKSWFINLKKIKNKLIKLSNNINWCSTNLIKNKFKNWLNNINNWNISRSRFWGTPLPIWKTKNEKEFIVIGSLKELNKEIKKSIKLGFMNKNPLKNKNNIDLHKHFIDNIILSSKKNKKMYREPDVIDVWFDSGVSPYAQQNYPFKNKKLILPYDFITEGIDQTRGWFFTLHTISTIISNSISYKYVLPLGIILDKNGKKMSKSKGNTLDPFKIIKKYGPDCIRWYMVYNNLPWENLKFNINNIKKIKNKFFNTLYNIFIFFYNYSKIDKFNIKDKYKKKYIDYWILSKLNKLLLNTYKYYKLYNITYIARYIYNFVINDLSNWYIRLSRKRFWNNKYDNDKISAYNILYICLKKIFKISYPISPFFMEYLNKKLYYIEKKNKINIILQSFPKYKNKYINNSIEKNMLYIKKYSSIILSLRKKKNIKVRQPLNNVYIVKNKHNYKFLNNKEIISLLKNEVNIKNINFININKIKYYIKNKIKLNYKILGPKYKNNINLIYKLLNELNQKEIEKFKNNKYIYLNINDNKIKIKLNEIFIEHEILNKNILMYSNKNIIIILDIKITNELKNECFIRDLIRNIQILRKEKKYYLTDKINIIINKNIKYFIFKIILKYNNIISKNTLTNKIIYKNTNNKKFIIFNNKKIYFDIIKN